MRRVCPPLTPSPPHRTPPTCSYQGMGLARVTCAAGCSCKPILVDGLWRQRTSLMQMTSLQARGMVVGWQLGRALRLQVVDQPMSNSPGKVVPPHLP